MAVFFLLYAAAISTGIYDFISTIPIFNSHRWFAVGLEYTIFAMIAIVSVQFTRLCEIDKLNHTFLYAYIFFVLVFYVGNIIPVGKLYLFSIPILLHILHLHGIFKHATSIIVLVFILLNIYVHKSNVNFFIKDATSIIERLAKREINVAIISNTREQPNGSIYEYYNVATFCDKKPSTDGYNIVGNPIYWYFKNTSIVAQHFSITRDVREQGIELNNTYTTTSNDFIKSYTRDIIDNIKFATIVKDRYIKFSEDNNFTYRIDSVNITPSSSDIIVSVANNSYLLFSTVYVPGWKVYVNGKEEQLVKTNGIFMGVYLPASGIYNVKFIYHSICFEYVLYLIYALLFISIIFNIIYTKDKK